MKKKILPLLSIIFIHIFILINLSFTVWPEMILYPWLLNHGSLLYKEIINPYFPLLPITLAQFFLIFSESILALKVFTYLIIICSDLAVYFGSFSIVKSYKKALFSVIVFIILQTSIGGNGLWFELFLTPFLITSIILIYQKYNSNRLIFLSGLLFCVAVLTKQNTILFLFPIIYWLSVNKLFLKILIFLSPLISCLIIFWCFLINFNIVNDFLIWAIKLPLSFTNQQGFVLLPNKRQYLLILMLLLPIIGYALFNKTDSKDKILWLMVFLLSASFAFPRFEDFHLQVLIAFAALFSVSLPKKIAIVFFVIILIVFSRFVIKNFHQNDRFIDQNTLILSTEISKLSSVYLLNSPELAYFFGNKLPPKIWATNFPWYFEQTEFQQRFIGSLINERTEYIIIGDRLGGDKYALGNYIPEKLEIFINDNYYLQRRFNNYSIWQRKLNSH